MTTSDWRSALLDAYARRFGERAELPESFDGGPALASLLRHGTCRRYSAEPVDPRLVRLICAAALSAPSKSDLQQADILEVTDRERRAGLAALIPTMEWVREAPVFLVVLANGRRLRQVCTLHGETFANDHLDAFFNATLDAGVVLGQLIAAAEAAGLGTCPISAVRKQARRVSDLLSLPEHVFPVSGLCLGWPDAERRVAARLPLALTLQQAPYDDARWKALLLEYDERRGRADGWDPSSPEFRGWSQHKAKAFAEPQHEDFGAYVRAQGFDLA